VIPAHGVKDDLPDVAQMLPCLVGVIIQYKTRESGALRESIIVFDVGHADMSASSVRLLHSWVLRRVSGHMLCRSWREYRRHDVSSLRYLPVMSHG
jgi:hypothetical protein